MLHMWSAVMNVIYLKKSVTCDDDNVAVVICKLFITALQLYILLIFV